MLREPWDLVRSIPTSAGEPATRSSWPAPSPVYPRECGGTRMPSPLNTRVAGLSPRVRGNRPDEAKRRDHRRSIPASAGEPHHLRPADQPGQVYPRECGGTSINSLGCSARKGLSPRVRGNLTPPTSSRPMIGSIPASAGEPANRWAKRVVGEVYPRECGGTQPVHVVQPKQDGLSPRVRGNRMDVYRRDKNRGSIPASAGEPLSSRSGDAAIKVYPRECGGTLL